MRISTSPSLSPKVYSLFGSWLKTSLRTNAPLQVTHYCVMCSKRLETIAIRVIAHVRVLLYACYGAISKHIGRHQKTNREFEIFGDFFLDFFHKENPQQIFGMHTREQVNETWFCSWFHRCWTNRMFVWFSNLLKLLNGKLQFPKKTKNSIFYNSFSFRKQSLQNRHFLLNTNHSLFQLMSISFFSTPSHFPTR